MNTIEKTLFAVLRSALGIEKMTGSVSLRPRQWRKFLDIVLRQQVTALVYDELETVGSDMPEDVKGRWKTCHEFLVKRFDAQLLTLTQLSAMLEAENVRMMVLKGVGLALTYPKPQLRECVDIDIFCFDDYREVNEFVTSRGIGKNPKENDWEEFCFEFGGIEVENHGRFTTDCNTANKYVDEVLMRMNAVATPSQDSRLPGILIPAPQVGALHLIMHTLSHLAWSGITVRHLCDITMYLRHHGEQIDFKSLRRVFNEAGLEKSAALLLDICNSHLGLGLDISGWAEDKDNEAKAVLHSIFHPLKGSVVTRNPLRKFYRKVVMHRFRSRLHFIVYGEKFPDRFLDSFAVLKRFAPGHSGQ